MRPHCRNGHAFTPENTYVFGDGKRQCRTCRRKVEIARRERGDLVPFAPRMPERRRSDREVIGAMWLAGYDGRPMLLAHFAALIGETVEDLELRGGILARWLEMAMSDRGPVLYGRRIAYGEVRDFLDGVSAQNRAANPAIDHVSDRIREVVWMESEAA